MNAQWRIELGTRTRIGASKTRLGDVWAGCHHSPTGKHEHRDDSTRCEWCGSVSYGAGCHHSPTSKHRYGPGEGKCIWCGSKASGAKGYRSPTKVMFW